MPQMSPMNWIILSICSFFLLNIISSSLSTLHNKNISSKTYIKTLKWKW